MDEEQKKSEEMFPKSWDEMSLFEQWQYARDNFQHYSIRYIYDTGDGFRRTVSSEEKQYCFDMANKWDSIIKELRQKIDFLKTKQ